MRKSIIAIASLMMMVSPAFAQDNNAEAPANSDASAAQEGPTARAATPQEITKSVHGDWQIRCVTVEPQQCFLYQLIVDNNNSPILEYSLVPAKDETGGDVKMVGTLITPLNTVLSRGVIMQVDENDPVQRDYTTCAPVGCFSRYGLTGAQLDQYRGGKQITAVIFMIQSPDQGIELPLSLNGFGDAYDELMEIEAEQAAG